jgi:hypothetical protein
MKSPWKKGEGRRRKKTEAINKGLKEGMTIIACSSNNNRGDYWLGRKLGGAGCLWVVVADEVYV